MPTGSKTPCFPDIGQNVPMAVAILRERSNLGSDSSHDFDSNDKINDKINDKTDDRRRDGAE
jgi:hypothetical protein